MPRRKGVAPIEKFPLKPRADGRYQKRIRNQLHYFYGATRDEARAEYDRVKADLYAGKAPAVAPADAERLKLKELASLCLAEKEADRDAGRITPDTYGEYVSALNRFLAFRPKGEIGFARRLWADLRREDFAAYARYLQKCVGPHAYNRERSRIATMFNMADPAEYGWISRTIKLGRAFPRRTTGEARGNRNDWLLAPPIIRALWRAADVQFRAMILLGLNGGYGPGDCAKLPRAKVDPAAARIKFPRPKNNIDRDMPAWAETIAALRAVFRARPGDDLVFRTAAGNPWNASSIGHRFAEIRRKAGVVLPRGVGLNACRHTFATYAVEAEGFGPAYKRLMGRKITDGVDETYIDKIFLPKLKRIVSHVYRRLQIGKIILNPRRR